MRVIHRRNPDVTVQAREDAGWGNGRIPFSGMRLIVENCRSPLICQRQDGEYREMENPTDQHYQLLIGLRCAWYCIRSKPKHEHIAARNLRRLRQVEVFNPRFRLRKITRRGPAWVTESLFPNYLFVRFPFHQMLDEVRFTHGVSN